MLSMMLFHGDPASTSAVLVFLHGIGEAFHNPKTNSIGLKNLFQQGIPKILFENPINVLGPEHPLMVKFDVLAPQLPERESVWNEAGNVEQIRGAIRAISAKRQRPIYIIGFSKGGRAAFQLAKPLGCKAIVTIDASPLLEDVPAVAKEILECSVPVWMIFTSYPEGHTLNRISNLHHTTAIDNYEIKNLAEAVPPKAGTRRKSLVRLDQVSAGDRHGALCTEVSRSRAPYHWLLMHC